MSASGLYVSPQTTQTRRGGSEGARGGRVARDGEGNKMENSVDEEDSSV